MGVGHGNGRGVLVRLLALLALLALGVAGCGTDATLPPASAGKVVDHSTVTKVIGAEGGTLEHPTGAKVIIPAGALTASATIAMTGIDAPAASVLGGPSLGQGFRMEPDGLTFGKTVNVVVPFDPTLMPPGSTIEQAQVLTAPGASTAFSALETSGSLTTGRLEARTLHFSTFIPAQNPNPVFIKTKVLPDGTVGTSFTASMAAVGGTPPYSWAVVAGGVGLPPGLALASTGTLSGTPTQVGVFDFNVLVNDTGSNRVQRSLAITIVPSVAPAPTLASVAPATTLQGSDDTTITLGGTGLTPTTVVTLDGTNLATTYVSATQIRAVIPKARLATAGTAAVGVTTPPPGGGTSNTLVFTITATQQNPLPSVASVDPNSASPGASDTQVTITGTNFIASSKVVIGQQELSAVFVSATELDAIVPAALVASPAVHAIRVANPAPGGGTSTTSATFTVVGSNPAPTVATMSPTSATAGGAAFTLAFEGSNFVQGAQVFFGGVALTTTVNSATSATASVPAIRIATAGTYTVTINNPTPGGGPSANQSFSVVAPNPVPTLASIAPSQVNQGSSDTLITLTGTGFVSGAKIYFGATVISGTIVDATTATATVPANLLTAASTVQVKIGNPAPGGGDSGTKAFTIAPVVVPVPVLTDVTPAEARVNSQTRSVNVWANDGSFQGGALVYANGTALGTIWVNPYSLYAEIPANMMQAVGTISITAKNPGGAASNPLTFTVKNSGNAVPTVTSISPTSVALNTQSPTVITITGTGFVNGGQQANSSAVYWRFAGEPSSSHVSIWGTAAFVVNSATQMTLTLQPGIQLNTAGAHKISVANPAIGGGQSTEATFTVTGQNPVPDIASVGPAGPFGTGTTDVSLSLKASGSFVSRTQVTATPTGGSARFLGYCGTYGTACKVTIPASLMAQATTLTIEASSPTPGGGVGTTATVSVVAGNPTPQLAAQNPVNPTTLTRNAPGQLVSLSGSGFIAATTVKELQSNTTIPITQQTASMLQINVPASLLDGTRASLQFAVTNPAPGGGSVVTDSLPVVAVATVTSFSPSPVPINTAFTLTITGTNLDLAGTATFNYDGVNFGQLTPASRTATTWTINVPANAFTTAGFQNAWLRISGHANSNSFEVQAN